MPPLRRMFKEEFQEFFENPSLESLPYMLDNATGEQSYLEFKEQWPSKGDVAKHILAFCNTQGGLLVIGVSENRQGTNRAAGMTENFKDDADFKSEMDTFLPETAMNLFELRNFDYSDWHSSSTISGKRFQIVFVDYDPSLIPIMSRSARQDVSRETIYIRRGASTREARHDDIQSLLTTRIEAGLREAAIVDLSQELEQLKTLYSQIPSHIREGGALWMSELVYEAVGKGYWGRKVENPEYPEESFDKFIKRMIEEKKRAIGSTLGLKLEEH